jgi:putative addiction module component (TIGR02574 family)
MNSVLTKSQIDSLSVPERLELMDDVWASLAAEPRSVPIPAWHEEILRQRMATFEADKANAVPWDEVRERLLARHRK